MAKIKILFIFLIFFIPFNVFSLTEPIILSECVDGDTAKFYINGKEKTVRFLAIDTEETKSTTKDNTFMGFVASIYTCLELKLANKIEIEYDSNASKDKYNRELGWIFVDNKLLQKKLVQKGYAKVAYLYDDYKYTDVLQDEQKIANENNLGIWNKNNVISNIYNIIQKLSKLFT